MLDISSLGTILGVWAHPDDEAFAMAGIMAAASQNGQTVACITATRGDRGTADPKRWPLDKIAQIRSKEMANSLKIVGCSDHTWLEYPDGGCDRINKSEAVAQIAKVINRVKPDTVFTFGLDGWTGHPDHRTISHWATAAFRQAAKPEAKLYYWTLTAETYEAMREADEQFNIFFNISHPKISSDLDLAINFELPKDLVKIKAQAIGAHISQTKNMVESLGKEFFEVTQNRECFCLGAEQ